MQKSICSANALWRDSRRNNTNYQSPNLVYIYNLRTS